jgi:hypothetical protein
MRISYVGALTTLRGGNACRIRFRQMRLWYSASLIPVDENLLVISTPFLTPSLFFDLRF